MRDEPNHAREVSVARDQKIKRLKYELRQKERQVAALQGKLWGANALVRDRERALAMYQERVGK